MDGAPIAELVRRIREEATRLDAELTEIELLAQQSRSEAERHESHRAATEAKLAAGGSGADLAELARTLVTQTKRAAMMESQAEVLAGKKTAVARHRESLERIVTALEGALGSADAATSAAPTAAPASPSAVSAPVPVAQASAPARGSGDGGGETRLVLGVQEDLRREIARAMHDGPAQSLTNIVLEAEIVERLLARDPDAARAEMARLKTMVQATLDATKSFIFDVRPMVLDDLGLLPTLRRAARDRGAQAKIPVGFDSLGPDRRLPVDLESAVFRILDEALVAFLELHPVGISIRLDWSDLLDARVAVTGGGVKLPAKIWTEVVGLAGMIGALPELLDDGATLRVTVPIPTVR